MDSMEAVWWGKFCLLGTNKHPPLSGFPAYGLFLLSGENIKSVYILSQICIAAGFFFIYRLACKILDRQKAVLSVMILEGCIFYGFCSPEYNVNVLSLTLWPAVAYYFYLSVTTDKLQNWCLLAFFSALSMLNKYTGGLQLLGCACFILCLPERKKFFKSYKPYVAALVFLLMVLPHFYWLEQHNFMVMEYFAARSGSEKAVATGICDHISSPALFLTSLAFYSAGSLALFFGFGRSACLIKPDKKDSLFLFWLGVFPILFVAACGLIGGQHIKSMWGYPLMYMLGIILFKCVKFKMDKTVFIKMQKAVYAVMLLYAIAYGSMLYLSTSPKYNLDNRAFATRYTDLWHKQTGKPLKYVIGEVWLPSMLVLQSEDKPKPVVWGKLHRNPWVDAGDFNRTGALVLVENMKAYKAYTSDYADRVSPPQIEVLKFSNALGKMREKKIYYGFVKGEENVGENH